jgi:very-short-patch-repair endonuclease
MKDYKAQFLSQLKMAGIPAPEAEVRFHPVRKWRFDFCWPSEKLAVEYQGGIYYGNASHSSIGNMKRDCEKFSEAVALGWRVMPINADLVRSGRALQLVEMALKHQENHQ